MSTFVVSFMSFSVNECMYQVILFSLQVNVLLEIEPFIYHAICCSIRLLDCSVNSLIVMLVGSEDSDITRLFVVFVSFRAPIIVCATCSLSSVCGEILWRVVGMLKERSCTCTILTSCVPHPARNIVPNTIPHRL